MFDSDLLDKLSRVHPAVPVIIYVPEIAILLALAGSAGGASTLGLIGLFVGGYFFWTLMEYWIHRVIFHFEPEEGFGARLHWIIHGVHHDHPNDPLRLVMPPSVSLPLSSLFLVGFWAVLGTPLWYSFGAGFIAGYLIYDMTHYHLHHHKPKTRMGKRLRELHMRHHFQDDTTGFGISAPYWDSAFGTHSPKAKKAE
jgi:sterol desaturase/sphingolipid hydroxylase (fatty acid hydroxylase superfamily)